MKINIKVELELELEVEGNFYPKKYGTFYKSNGDPGDEPEAASFEIQKVKWGNIDITEKLDEKGFDWNALEEKCIETLEN
jgi:hypothetical protein